MITSTSIGQDGRLGNQLFQYAALRSLGLKNGYETVLINPGSKEWHGQKCLLENFNIESAVSDGSALTSAYSEPDYMKFDDNFFSLPDGVGVRGYFQSMNYFKEFEGQIRKELTPKEEFLSKGRTYVDDVREEFECDVVSVHLRRGDNTDDSNPSGPLNSMYGGDKLSDGSFYGKYISKALKYFEGRSVKFLVFTGGKRFSEDNSGDVEWCKNSFIGKKFLFSEGAGTMEDFCRIMSCDHHIISHVSSFGWWAAYLNDRKDKEVIAPERYHPDRPEFTHRDGFYPKEWILL